ncbi:CapA family protein [Candidatus Woesearchaeota archaeon]|nr:CapA family protein [Candidatus Woesearchaeota archaeon]
MVSLVFVGDVMLGRRVDSEKNIFKNVKDLLKKGDITFGNLECPLCEGLDYVDKKYVFSAKEDCGKIIKDAGFDLLSIANNHIIDCREKGLENTKRILEKNNLKYLGVGKGQQRPTVIEKDGIRIGFLAYCKKQKIFKELEKIPYITGENMIEDIKNADVDFLVVSVHWGREYNLRPSEKQIKLAKKMIENGADIVVGHHAHIPQKIEEYKGGVIAYSLGNFVFDQIFNPLVMKSKILQVDIDSKGIKDYEVINSVYDEESVPSIETYK